MAKGIDIVKSVPDVLTKKIPKAVFKDAPQKIVDVRTTVFETKANMTHCISMTSNL